MNYQGSGRPSISKVYNLTQQSVKNNPTLFIPFLSFFIIDCAALILLFLAPRMPLSLIFGPIIRTFWGEKFLHYPLNFLLLPRLSSLGRMVLSVFLGSLLTGMAVAMIFDIYNKKRINLGTSFKTALKKYVYLFTVVFIFTALFYVLTKIIILGLFRYFMSGHARLLFLGARVWLRPVLVIINFILAVLIQAAFIYAIPILIIEKEKLIKSISKSFALFKKQFIPTIILVGLPMFLFIPIIVMNYNASFLIDKLFPEFILLVAFSGTIISSLVIDAVITISTTFLYLMQKEKT